MREEKTNGLGTLLKDLLTERSVSMRKLSELTDIDTSTISRIISGKRKAKPEHLQKLADCLEVPVSELFAAAGFSVGQRDEQQNPDDLHSSIESIQMILGSMDNYNKEFTIQSVEKHLNDYAKFAETDEGRECVLKGFEEKLHKVGSIGPFLDMLKDMFIKFRMIDGTKRELALMGGALLYFIFPVDVIPDYIFPLGYLDDALVVKIVTDMLTMKS